MQPDTASSVSLEVRVGAHGGPEIHVEAGGRRIPIAVTPQQAAALGVALISAGALFSAGQTPPAPGEMITGSNLPVKSWKVGANTRSGHPAVQLTVLGGASLVLQFTHENVVACGRMLQALGPNQQKDDGISKLSI